MSPDETLLPEAIEQQPHPQSAPAGRVRLQQLHAYLVKEKTDVPEDYKTFEEKLLEKPERLKQLHDFLVKEKTDVPADYSLFEEKLTEGLKKKAQASELSLANAGGPSVPVGPNMPATPTPDEELAQQMGAFQAPGPLNPQALDEPFQPQPQPAAAPEPPASLMPAELADDEQTPEDVRLTPEPGQSTALPPEAMAAINHLPAAPQLNTVIGEDGQVLDVARKADEGFQPVDVTDLAGQLPPTAPVYRVMNGDQQRVYYDRPLSKEVDGREQTTAEAAFRNFGNQLLTMGQGGLDYLGAADRKLHATVVGQFLDSFDEKLGAAPYDAADPNVFQAGADAVEGAKGKVAPFYAASEFRMTKPATWAMATSNVAALALPTLVSVAFPEGRVAEAVQAIAGAGFDAQMLEDSFQRARASGLQGEQLDNYALADGAATMLVFKLGGMGLNAAGQQLAKTELMASARAQLARTGGRLSEGALGEAFAKAGPRVAAILKSSGGEGGTMGVLMAANTVKEKAGERLANQALGRPAFPEQSLAQDAADVAGSFGEGALLGGSLGAVRGIRAPLGPSVVKLGRSAQRARELFAELGPDGQPTRYLDDQGQEIDFGPQGPPPAVHQAVGAARATKSIKEPATGDFQAEAVASAESMGTASNGVFGKKQDIIILRDADGRRVGTMTGSLVEVRRAIANGTFAEKTGKGNQPSDVAPEASNTIDITNYQAPEPKPIFVAPGTTENSDVAGPSGAVEPGAAAGSVPVGDASASEGAAPETVAPEPVEPSLPQVEQQPTPVQNDAEGIEEAVAPKPIAEPHPDHVTPLTAKQQATNDALDALDRYNELGQRAKKGKEGVVARLEISRAADKAGLALTVGNDFKTTLTRTGKRATRTNEYTGTTPALNHVPLAERPEAARPFLERVVQAADGFPAVVQGIGVELRGKPLSARELGAAVEDIKSGRNTLRANLVLDALENAHRRGYVEKSEGTGLATRKYAVPVDDYVGEQGISAAGKATPLADAELDALVANNSAVKQAVDDYIRPDGTIDYERIASDGPNGLQFLFDIDEANATKLVSFAHERISQNTNSGRTEQPATQTGTDSGSQAQGPSRADGASGGNSESAGPDARAAGPKFYADLAEAPPAPAQAGRIQPAPIRGEKPKEQDKIILDVHKSTGIAVVFSKRPGRQNASRALGSYNPRNAAVTVRASADLDVTAHELGHALDDRYDLIPSASNEALDEIYPLSKFGSQPPAGHLDPGYYRDGEALAEYVRAYLVNPEATRAAYPEFTAHYEENVPYRMRTAVDNFGRDIRVFAGATAHEQVMSNVRMKPEAPGGVMSILKPEARGKAFMLTFGDRVQATMLNALHPFEKAMNYAKEVGDVGDLLPEQNPNVLARLFLGLNDKMDNLMRNGLVDARNERVLDADTQQPMNLTWLLEPLDKTTEGTIAAEQEQVVSYMVAQRTVELAERFGEEATLSGIGAGIYADISVAQARLAEVEELATSNPEQHARILEAARRYQAFADQNLRYLVDRGRMSEDQYAAIKENNAQYVAMQRVMEAEPGAAIEVFGQGPGGKSFMAAKQPLQKIQGSGRTIKNPYSALLDSTYRVVREGDRNAIMQAMRELFVGSRTMNDGPVEELGAVARPAAEGDPHTVPVFVDGQRETWQLDADVFQAINELANAPLDGPLAKLLKAPGSLLRWSVTHSPVFAVRNVIRDTRSRLIVSTNTPESGFDVLTNKQARQESRDGLELAGGGQAGHYLRDETAYYDTMQKEMGRLATNKKFILADPAQMAKDGWQKYTATLGQSETIGRLMEYRSAFKKAKAQGMDEYNASLFAAHEARDLMDFAVAGTFLRQVNKYVPFTNAAVQGLRRAARSAKENPGGMAARWMLYSVVPTMLVRGLIHQMKRDEEYAQLPAYQRDGFDNIPLANGKWLVIPRPFELGTLAASTDRFFSQQVADDPQAWEGYTGSLGKSFVPADESAIAGGLKPIIEVLTNHDFFKDRTIISPSEEKLDLSLRHTERGSRLGQWIGNAVGMDSRNVDHLVTGTGSYYGNWLLKASNFGREDGNTFGVPDTGFIKDQPVTQARDVQWLQQKLEGAGLGQGPAAATLEKILQAYYAQKTDEDRKEVGKLATDYSRTLRTVLDEKLIQEAGRAKKERRETQQAQKNPPK